MMNIQRWTLAVSFCVIGSMQVGPALAQAPLEQSTISVDANRLTWTWVDATGYDLVRVDLGALRQTGGDYTTAVRACLGDDLPVMQFELPYAGAPKVGEVFGYLVRAVTESSAGSFDSGGPGQVGSRDAEIRAARTACFEPVTPYGRISIKGDGQFTSSRGVVAGTGSVADPFVIAGWDILCGNPANAPGIKISDTGSAFVIRDVRVRSCQDGIVFDGVGNAAIERSRLTDDQRGVVLDGTNGIRLEGNRFDAIAGTAVTVLGGGGGHLFTRNTITGAAIGLDLEGSMGASIFRNNLIGNATQAIAHGGCCITWSRPYPEGGNFWDDYPGDDLCAGPFQNLCAPGADNDGIGDQQRAVADFGSDLFPLMAAATDEGDTLRPTLNITWPPQGTSTGTPTAIVQGEADDAGVGVDHVDVRLNGGAWMQAYGLTPWSRSLTLEPGPNLVEAVAVDRAGNQSPMAGLTVTYNPPAVWASSIEISQASFPPGVPVPITLRVTNTSAYAGILTFADTCEANFTVANAGGTILYDQLSHDICFAVFSSRNVPAGGSVTYSWNWMQVNNQGAPVPSPASYTIRGISRAFQSIPDQTAVVTITP